MLINKLEKRAWLIQTLIFTKTSNIIKEINLNCPIYIYINERILSCPVKKVTNSKLKYIHGLEIKKENMIDLEEIMLQEEVGKNEKGINIEDGDTRE